MFDSLSPDAVPYTTAGLRQAGLDPVPSPATRHRWRLRGVRGQLLTTFMRGGRRYVTREALAEFFDAVTAAADGARRPSAENVQATRDQRIANAQAELDSEDILRPCLPRSHTVEQSEDSE